MVKHSFEPFIIIGAGPAGLTAAYAAVERGLRPLVLEGSNQVGGLARTVVHNGYRFDIGGHRFYTKEAQIQALWQEMLGTDFLLRPRLSRIYYQRKLFKYPIQLLDALPLLGPLESLRVLLSYLASKAKPYPEERTFEQWVSNRFGRRLFDIFFRSYTEKVWGISTDQISAEWAAQRIQGLTMKSLLLSVWGKHDSERTLISEFHYPLSGPGMMWDVFQQRVEDGGGQVRVNSLVKSLQHANGRIEHALVQTNLGLQAYPCSICFSTMPLGKLVQSLDPPAPQDVLAAAVNLRQRAFFQVGLVLDKAQVFADNWIYVHDPSVRVGRIQNFKNWSPGMTADPARTHLGMEYFCNQDDGFWTMPDADLVAMASHEIEVLGLAKASEICSGLVIRQSDAYPVYDSDYRTHLVVVRDYLSRFSNLTTLGRGGLHRYNNMDHSMLTGLHAVDNLFGAGYDLWKINTDRSYYETFIT